ncbi:hypothetical protein PInf_026922 [Phytophthora infestans]|nr:hypothetical protein PInf_026922 [Phytophthora infestans]
MAVVWVAWVALRMAAQVKAKTGSAANVASKVVFSITASSKARSVAHRTGSTAKTSSQTGLAAESVAFVPSKSGSASKTGSAAKTSSKTGPPTGSVATAPSTAGPVASTAVFVSTQSGFTAGSTAAVSTIPRPALSRSQLMGAGSGKAKVKRHIPTGCGLGSSEDDEEDDG